MPRGPTGQGGNGTLILGPGGPVRHGADKNAQGAAAPYAAGRHGADKEGARQKVPGSSGADKSNSNKEGPPPIPCKFEELNNDFLIQREIGRGSYGVVFKAIRNPYKFSRPPFEPLNAKNGETAESHN